MRRVRVLFGLILFVSVLLGIYAFLLRGHDVAVLSPAGEIAEKQRSLIYFALGLSLVVVVPVFAMTFAFAWKYRESNKKAEYRPDWDGSKLAETIWWGVPIILITILSVVTWRSTHALDPFKKLESTTPAMDVQVVALDWKWLFIYPNDNVASVNYARIPVDTPVTFHITSDAPMNSFWVPKLGGQIYAMSGMTTNLNLIAEVAGKYNGSSANISGKGFADMRFVVEATRRSDFDAWTSGLRQRAPYLDDGVYAELSKQSIPEATIEYGSVRPGLYDTIVAKYMGGHVHTNDTQHDDTAHGEGH